MSLTGDTGGPPIDQMPLCCGNHMFASLDEGRND